MLDDLKAVAPSRLTGHMVLEMPEAPLPRGLVGTFGYSEQEIEKEALRLQ